MYVTTLQNSAKHRTEHRTVGKAYGKCVFPLPLQDVEALLGVNSDKQHGLETGNPRATNWRQTTDYSSEIGKATPMSK